MWIRREMGDWCCSPWYCLSFIHCWLPCGRWQPGSCFVCEKRGEVYFSPRLYCEQWWQHASSPSGWHGMSINVPRHRHPLLSFICWAGNVALDLRHVLMGLWSGIEQWWVQLNDGGRRWWGWCCNEGGWLGRKWLFVDNVFVCWMFVDTMFVLNVPQKTSYNQALSSLANIEIMTNQRPDHSYG